MAVHYRTNAIVFKKEDRAENDRTFTAFTYDFGKLDVYAKAIRKINSKLRAGIDIFYLSEIEFIRGKNNKTLTDAEPIEKNSNIFYDFEKIKIAYQITNVLEKFIKGQQEDKEIWNLLVDTFKKLNVRQSSANNQQLLYYYFFWNFFSVLGYRPEILKCAVCCGKLNPYNIYFSDKEGGIICKKCLEVDKEAKKINSDVVKVLRLILTKDWKIISKLKIDSASQKLFETVTNSYHDYILPAHSFK
jgi:DNA repair protein RecO (recombination protein O)